MNYYTYMGYERRKNGFAISLLEKVREGEGMRPVLVQGKYGKDMPWVSDTKFAEHFANLAEGAKIDIVISFGGSIRNVDIVES